MRAGRCRFRACPSRVPGFSQLSADSSSRSANLRSWLIAPNQVLVLVRASWKKRRRPRDLSPAGALAALKVALRNYSAKPKRAQDGGYTLSEQRLDPVDMDP